MGRIDLHVGFQNSGTLVYTCWYRCDLAERSFQKSRKREYSNIKSGRFGSQMTVYFRGPFNIISGNMGESQMIRFLSRDMARFDIKKLIWKTVNFVFSHFGLSGIILFNPGFETKRLCEFKKLYSMQNFYVLFLTSARSFSVTVVIGIWRPCDKIMFGELYLGDFPN